MQTTFSVRCRACLTMILAGLFFSLLFPAGGKAGPLGQPAELRVLATTFPVYLFTRNVAHSRPYVHVELLIPAPRGCPHDYSLTPRDMQKLDQAQVLVINGLGLEDFLGAPLQKNNSLRVIDSSAGIAPLSLPPGAQAHVHGKHNHNDVNPHLFASPQQAAAMTYTIANGLARIDPAGAAAYRAAAEAYAARLLSLGRRLHMLGICAPRKGIVLQHDALAYLAHDAGLDVMAVIQESEDMQPSAARLIALAKLIRQEKPVLIAGEPQYSDKPALALSRETGVPTALLDPVASGPADAPLDYYETVMSANCRTLEHYFDPR
ncbi:metal ABC transporter substrate-binding protein [Desulfovibrio sp. ZJ200]|uniref:metal ABC transporter substrate-binding protein n=1 Tax=Desulfovibrio sp. ZJ200 TaxID=2709792 RepID=UPI0013E9FC2A|nr:metal ABC transporter substrate-binding protein [Desulfovibrio sp. ZJ200]